MQWCDSGGRFGSDPFDNIARDIRGEPCGDGFRRGLQTIIDENVTIGRNVYIGNFCHIRPNTILGDGVEIRDYCFLGPDVVIGDETFVYQYCNISMGTIIGKKCYIGIGTVTCNDKNIAWPDKGDWKPEAPVIEDFVRIGVRAIILPKVRLGHHCLVGAGSVVTRDILPYAKVIGNPARRTGWV